MTPRPGLGCHVTCVNEPGVHCSDTFLPEKIDREIASITVSEVFHVCSCCCKAVTGRIVCWQFRQAITRDLNHTLIIPSSWSSKTLEASTYRQPFENGKNPLYSYILMLTGGTVVPRAVVRGYWAG